MGSNQWLQILLVSSVGVLSISCDQNTGDLLRGNVAKSSSSRFETISEAPSDKPPETNKAKNRLGDAGKVTTAPIDFLPTGPSPFPAAPPIPTDDDFFDDNYIQGPSIPYGVCGNGHVDFHEQCDDGNDDNTDGCNVLCEFPVCGNGVLEKNEECDDGDTEDGNGCNHRCDFERCGNKCIDENEQCDDGNLEPGDGCSPCCLYEVCGNKVIDPKEECDDGNDVDDDGCSRFCEREVCGNGITTRNEQCDDGNTIDTDCCTNSCTVGTCAAS